MSDIYSITSPAPVALFVYNRPLHTRLTVEALARNELADKSNLFVFCDSAKSDRDRTAVNEVREYVGSITGFQSVTVVQREENLGLAQSIITGVTQIINSHSRIIVLEDDLVTSPYFLRFMNDALDRYEKEERVMHITGYMYPIPEVAALNGPFFYREAHSWGWGTWKRAWDTFEPDPGKLLSRIRKSGMVHEFDIQGSAQFCLLLKYQSASYVDSWMIRWYASVFLQNGLCLFPARSLVSNIGNDGSGTHTGKIRLFDVILADSPVLYFPEKIEESKEALTGMMRFHERIKRQRFKRFIWLWRKKASRLLQTLRTNKS